MATIKCCDLCKNPISQGEVIGLTLTNGLDQNSFELDNNCYTDLLNALVNNQKTDTKPMVSTPIYIPEPPPIEDSLQPTSQMVANTKSDDILEQSRIFKTGTLPALSSGSKRDTAKRLEEFNRTQSTAFNRKHSTDGIRLTDLTESDIDDKMRR